MILSDLDKQLLFEESYNAADDTLTFLLEYWNHNPKRKGAMEDIRKIKSRFELERERNASMAAENKGIRSYPAMDRAMHLALSNPVNSKRGRIRQWLKSLKPVGVSASICTVVLLIAAGLAG